MKVDLVKDNVVPPRGGFVFTQPETGWRSMKNLGLSDTAKQVQQHRLANPRFKLTTDLGAIKQELIDAAAKRCNYDSNYFVVEGGPTPKAWLPPFQGGVAEVAGAVKRTVSGIRTLWDWVGDGGAPVDVQLAEVRAKVCEACPLNERVDWRQVLKVTVAKRIAAQIEVKHDMNLHVPNEDKLGVCSACDCYMGLKVWVPMGFIRDYTSVDTKGRYHPDCWVLREWGA